MTDYPAIPIPDRAKAAAGPISDPDDYAARHAVEPAEIEGDDDAQAIADRAAESARATHIGQARAAIGRKPLDVRPFIDPEGARRDEINSLLDRMSSGPQSADEMTGGAVKPTRKQIRASRRRGHGKVGQAKKPKWCPAHETYHLVPVTE